MTPDDPSGINMPSSAPPDPCDPANIAQPVTPKGKPPQPRGRPAVLRRKAIVTASGLRNTTKNRGRITKALSPESKEDALLTALGRSPGIHFEACVKIQDKEGNLIQPKENYLQRLMGKLLTKAYATGRPFRAMVLKPRQKGSSTWTTHSLYHRSKFARVRAAIVGGSHQQSANLMKILGTYAATDELTEVLGGPVEVLADVAKFKNGSTVDRLTARNPEVGRSGTYQVLICTEVARWAEEGVANAKQVLSGLLKCVAWKPGTVIWLESTAAGASGDFYERWQDAIEPEEWLAGREGYVRIFAPWWAFEDCRRDPESEKGQKHYVPPDKARELALRWNLDDEQVAWMQWAVREECRGDFDLFCQDYPFDAESAFLSSGRRRFNGGGLRLIRERATHAAIEHGVLERQKDGQAIWRRCAPEESMVRRWEQPMEGKKYLVTVDPATGASQTSGKDPDRHGVFVLRAGYFDSVSGWVKPATAAALPPVEWDIDVLGNEILKLSEYYAGGPPGCLIVPEVNMDRGLIEFLKQAGATIYQREMFNRREFKRTQALGFQTNVETRGMVIERLATAIREWDKDGDGIEVLDLDACDELEHFVVKPNGKAEADDGWHDDRVLALAIGLACIDGATMYSRPMRHRSLPPDLRKHMTEAGSQAPGYATFA
jgi:hypothetical protein